MFLDGRRSVVVDDGEQKITLNVPNIERWIESQIRRSSIAASMLTEHVLHAIEEIAFFLLLAMRPG